MRSITVKEYFDYINKQIDNMTDEELLRLLEEIENSKEDSIEELYYDFEIAYPVGVNTSKIENNDYIDNLSLKGDMWYSTYPYYVFENNEEININIEDLNIGQKVA
ncbi:hypothetical protein ELD05_11975 [Caldicellulosiruptor changbaiensis]|uniref:Uncharacterized protein n=1 Tax=Caldicellulosiruptor changbaiensis TaxID=1222016 RepID=A0A3T0D802_9FIRM|nr:hypothetical protein [Caldicellulosiruptor changbaiensis]AZT91275.1 hypothetical protein ELD05_11975 [Caldicellulosiruptor changbaiensis]